MINFNSTKVQFGEKKIIIPGQVDYEISIPLRYNLELLCDQPRLR
ncbi:hypothetical protein POREN0001_0732 [Porphyromonas endodontalis ATCC 35406]|uniref:Uncharacterized protein n=1 Tax=Porphyromonas endodontalis (strain ATCC 35406 / DSM 24491 / JCM 8526 / CCUG 16442 / BCRC 14492 / NCTC 13058 / HG 370) TaxID=553175 RepID=C3J9I1_POREA|nr:hypothetical protein POREN0001_0732 [Porphyromonas endodontalis ATCC 35406]